MIVTLSLSGKDINFFQRSNIIISINFYNSQNSTQKYEFYFLNTPLILFIIYILFLHIQKLIYQENLYTSRPVFHSLSHL